MVTFYEIIKKREEEAAAAEKEAREEARKNKSYIELSLMLKAKSVATGKQIVAQLHRYYAIPDNYDLKNVREILRKYEENCEKRLPKDETIENGELSFRIMAIGPEMQKEVSGEVLSSPNEDEILKKLVADFKYKVREKTFVDLGPIGSIIKSVQKKNAPPAPEL